MREDSLSSLCKANSSSKERNAVFVAHFQDNNHTIEFMKAASGENAISIRATPWFIFLKQDQANLEASELNLDINSEVYLCNLSENNVISIKEAYKRQKTGDDAFVLPWGVWDGRLRELTVTSLHKWHRRRNLDGVHIKAATIHSPPYIYTSEPNLQGHVEITGFQADVWHELARICNFTYEAVLSRDGTWGRRLANGSYNGMMGMLVDGEVEFLIADFYATEGRAAVGDFSASVAYDT